MREIKFRIWDKTNKFMEELSYPWAVIDNDVWNISDNKKWDNTIIMQYTGLKEIYEGDIVAFKHITDMNTYNEWEAGFGIVKFGEYECNCDEYSGIAFGFYVEGYDEYKRRNGELDRYNDYKSILKVMDWEIIGNIYENPELLK